METPLHVAARLGHLKISRLLLDKGSNVWHKDKVCVNAYISMIGT
jgi:ankyrin repeat protein